MVIIRLEGRLQPNIRFTLRHAFSGVHAFGYNSAEIEAIWMISGAVWVHYRRLALADFWRDPHSSDSWRGEVGEIFLSGKQRTISPISRRPNFTKIEHNRSIDVAMKTFGTKFSKFYRKGSFEKRINFAKIFYILRLQAAVIPQWLQIAENSLPK